MEHLLALVENLITNYGHAPSYFVVFLVLLISGFGIPIPEDITLVTGGILAGQGFAELHWMLLVSMLGVLVGDSTMYFLGYTFGVKILRFRLLRKVLTAKRIQRVRLRFEDNSTSVLFIARFLPGLRAAIYLFSGITRKVSYSKFIAIDFAAAFISVPVWIGLGYVFGDNLHHLKHLMHRLGLGVSLTAIAAIVALFFIIKLRIRRAQQQREQERIAACKKCNPELTQADIETTPPAAKPVLAEVKETVKTVATSAKEAVKPVVTPVAKVVKPVAKVVKPVAKVVEPVVKPVAKVAKKTAEVFEPERNKLTPEQKQQLQERLKKQGMRTYEFTRQPGVKGYFTYQWQRFSALVRHTFFLKLMGRKLGTKDDPTLAPCDCEGQPASTSLQAPTAAKDAPVVTAEQMYSQAEANARHLESVKEHNKAQIEAKQKAAVSTDEQNTTTDKAETNKSETNKSETSKS